ncbi:MAG: hypothetical protein IJA04_05595 [Bacteroidaceae bacterium]|nr:hypothetical protein [Bacteroidaceae bacterium]
MDRFIYLNKEEKLAILKIIIDINNYYEYKLKADKYINDVASFFKLPNGITEAYIMPISKAKEILKKSFKDKASRKLEFMQDILSDLLGKSDWGVCGRIKAYWKEVDKELDLLENEKDDEIRKKKKEEIFDEFYDNIKEFNYIDDFIEEWNYVFKLLGKEILPRDEIEYILKYEAWEDRDTDTYYFKIWTLINDDTTINSPKPDEKPKATTKEIENTNNTSDINSVKDELRKKIKAELLKEIKDDLRKELKDELLKELKDIVQGEIKNALHKEMKDIAHNNFNETLYKDI